MSVRFWAFLTAMLSFPSALIAGGAHQTTVDGIPYRWEGGVVYNVDRGDLKPGITAYEHDAAEKIVQDAFATWRSALSVGDLAISEGVSLPLTADGVGSDVNAGNYSVYLNSNKTVNPIVFDADGEIIDAMFGDCSQFNLLAFSGFEQLDSDQARILKARAVFGGSCIPDAGGNTATKAGCGPCVMALDDNQVKTMILHELGHFLGMDHSQVNPKSYLECSADGLCPMALEDDLPTMFPLIVPGAAMQSLHRDDVAYFNRLYGNPQLDSCSVSGKVLAEDGQTELRGVEVVARNVDARFAETDAIAFISGAEAPRLSATSKARENCSGDCGEYLITGLREGQSYQLCVQNLLSQFQGGSGFEPVDPSQSLVSPDCPQGKTVTCSCSGKGCAEITGQDLVTSGFDAASQAQGNLSQETNASAGGCSLTPLPDTGAWSRLKKPLVFARRFQ